MRTVKAVVVMVMVLSFFGIGTTGVRADQPLEGLEITSFDCSGFVEATVPRADSPSGNEGEGTVTFFYIIVGDEGAGPQGMTSQQFSGPGVYSTQFVLPEGVDSFTATVGVGVAEDNEPRTDTYTIEGCAATEEPEPEPEPETGSINLTFALCESESCETTSSALDGATVTWTVDAVVSTESTAIRAFPAAQTTYYAAILENGFASTETEQLPLGVYEVCVEPTLKGGPNGDVVIADSSLCDAVALIDTGSSSPADTSFAVVLPDDSEPDEEAPIPDVHEPSTDDPSEETDYIEEDPTGESGVSLPSTGTGTAVNAPYDGIAGVVIPLAIVSAVFGIALRRLRMAIDPD